MVFFFYIDPVVLQILAGVFNSLLIDLAAIVIGGLIMHKILPPNK